MSPKIGDADTCLFCDAPIVFGVVNRWESWRHVSNGATFAGHNTALCNRTIPHDCEDTFHGAVASGDGRLVVAE